MTKMFSSFKIKTLNFSKPLNNLTVGQGVLNISSPVVSNVPTRDLLVIETKKFLFKL